MSNGRGGMTLVEAHDRWRAATLKYSVSMDEATHAITQLHRAIQASVLLPWLLSWCSILGGDVPL